MEYRQLMISRMESEGTERDRITRAERITAEHIALAREIRRIMVEKPPEYTGPSGGRGCSLPLYFFFG